MTAVGISGDLIGHVRQLYIMSLEYLASEKSVRQGINGYTHYALPAYIISVAAIEAYVNEGFLSDWPRITLKNSPIWKINKDNLDRMELGVKLIFIPQLLFGESFSNDSQPYQDMAILIKIRNEFIHYKMKHTVPKYLQALDDRGISMVGDYPWPHKLSSTEGIRWAHNTACNVVHELVRFASPFKPKPGPMSLAISLADNFKLMSDSIATDWLKKKGIDPNSNNP